MRVTNGYKSYQYQQQKAAAKQPGFADLIEKAPQPPVDASSFSEQATALPAEPDKSSSLALRFSLDFKFKCLANLLRSNRWMSDPAMVAALQAMQAGKPVAANFPATLTEEQTESIKNKYDVENLKWPSMDSVALGEELFSLGVIDDQQRKFFYGAAQYTEDPSSLGVLTSEGETPTRQTHYDVQPEDSMIDILTRELVVWYGEKVFRRNR